MILTPKPALADTNTDQAPLDAEEWTSWDACAKGLCSHGQSDDFDHLIRVRGQSFEKQVFVRQSKIQFRDASVTSAIPGAVTFDFASFFELERVFLCILRQRATLFV